MTREVLTQLFNYNRHINLMLSERFESFSYRLEDKILQLASHSLNAHQIWIDRIGTGASSLSGPWEVFPLEGFAQRSEELHSRTFSLLETCELNQILSYRIANGMSFERKVGDILFHVVNHYTYHRGQIALLMRSNGQEPIASDYIHWTG